ncbi:MAG TPA: hypothetical protein VM889_09550 [Candidatus Thermoplasmatota archaeon]|nr:hypothetical protein [Candidatus Thermoplasmatota archaeon]
MEWGEWILAFIDAHPILVLVAAFTLDSLGIPSVPEIATLIVFGANPTIVWALQILAIVVAVEVFAGWVLYALVKRFGVPPWLSKIMVKYSSSLMLADERLLLLNRIFPVLPFGGAFIHVAGWNVRRAFAFVAAGSAMKYALLLAFSGVAFVYLESDFARGVSLGGLVLFLVGSWFVASRRRKRLTAAPNAAAPQLEIAER